MPLMLRGRWAELRRKKGLRLNVSANSLRSWRYLKSRDIRKVRALVLNCILWQITPLQHDHILAFLNYYNVVLLSNFLTMMENICRYAETFLIIFPVLHGGATLNLIAFELLPYRTSFWAKSHPKAKRHPVSATFKNQVLLNLNLCGERYDEGFAEGADFKAFKGFMPFGGFSFSYYTRQKEGKESQVRLAQKTHLQ